MEGEPGLIAVGEGMAGVMGTEVPGILRLDVEAELVVAAGAVVGASMVGITVTRPGVGVPEKVVFL